MKKSKERVIENTQWGKIKLYLAEDGKCEVFRVTEQGEEFLSFYDGQPNDKEDRITAYIEMKMF